MTSSLVSAITVPNGTVIDNTEPSSYSSKLKLNLQTSPTEYDVTIPKKERRKLEEEVWAEFYKSRDGELRTWLFGYNKKIPLSISFRYTQQNPLSYRGSSLLEPDDIKQYAFTGLLEAIDDYDPFEGTKFNTFATYRIYGSIGDGLRSLQNFPRDVVKVRREIAPLIAILRQELQHEPTFEDLVHRFPDYKVGGYFGPPLSNYLDNNLVTASVYHIQELKENLGCNNRQSEVQVFENCMLRRSRNKQQKPYDSLERQMLIDKVIAILCDDHKERTVIFQYYFMGWTSAKIAKKNKFSEAVVSVKKISGIKRLRKAVKDDPELGKEMLELLST